MKQIGAHVSAEGGVSNCPLRANEIGAKAFSFFTKNQRRWVSPQYSDQEIAQFKTNLEESGISPSQVLPHSSYLINLGHHDNDKRELSINTFIDEINRCDQLGLSLLNFHPGSHLKELSEEKCMDLIAESINQAIDKTKNVTLVIENTAGQGSNIGYKFEQLAYLINKVTDKSRIGVCIDTCHLFVSGYDIRDLSAFEKTWKQFDEIVGFRYLKGMHINDTKTELGSKKDRHESIGKGNIGLKTFELLMKDPRFDEIPLILETIDPALWPEEIKLLYSLVN